MLRAVVSSSGGGGGGTTLQLLHIQDQKSSGTSGGTFTSGARRTRDLNTVVTNEITGASLAANQITLPAGTYYIDALSPAYNVSGFVAFLYNVTDAADVSLNSQGGYAQGSAVNCFLSGKFTISAQKVFELQNLSTGTTANIGFGVGNSLRSVEIYSDIKIWKMS